MRKRLPPFGLVLSTIVAAAALAIVLADRGASHPHPAKQPPSIGIGPARACVTTGAESQVHASSGIAITAGAQAPVSVTEQASGPKGTVTVTRSEVVTARIRADQPLEVKQTAGARRRACAGGDSDTAARTTALRQAYSLALAAAHAQATSQADQSLTTLLHQRYPSVLAEARARAAAQAHQLALAAASSLADEARSEARNRAGD